MDLQVFFNGPKGVKATLFGKGMTSSQVQGCQRIIVAHDLYSYGLDTALSYELTTSYHETGKRMQPIREANGTSTADTIRRLDRAWTKGQLKWVKTPYWRDGWFGRGDVQLTHEANYSGPLRDAVLAAFPGCDIHADPDLVLRPDISAFILIEGITRGHTLKADFTSYSLEQFIAPGKTDYRNARKTVNPKDAPTFGLLAGYAKKFEEAIREAREAAGEPFQDGVEGGQGLAAMPAQVSAAPAGVAAPVGLPGGAGRAILQGAAAVVLPEEPEHEDGEDPSLYDGSVNETVRKVQTLLSADYPEIGEPDGRWGSKTKMVVLGFRADRGLPLEPKIDDALLAELAKPGVRPGLEARREKTVAELADKPVIAQASSAITGSQVLTVVAGAFGVGKGAMTLSDMTERLNQAQALYDAAVNSLPFLGVAVVAGIGWYVFHRIRAEQVQNYRTAKLS